MVWKMTVGLSAIPAATAVCMSNITCKLSAPLKDGSAPALSLNNYGTTFTPLKIIITNFILSNVLGCWVT